jgi:hypothetical protein
MAHDQIRTRMRKGTLQSQEFNRITKPTRIPSNSR